MGPTGIDIKQFDGKIDITMWKKKTRATLLHKQCTRALNGEKVVHVKMSDAKKIEVL